MGGGSDWQASGAGALNSPTSFLLDSGFGLVANIVDCDSWGRE